MGDGDADVRTRALLGPGAFRSVRPQKFFFSSLVGFVPKVWAETPQ